MTKPTLYIGLMSGTSADGVDLSLVEFSGDSFKVIADDFTPYSPILRQQIIRLYSPDANEIDRMGQLDKTLAKFYADSIAEFLRQQHVSPHDITAIGNHGQTVRHRPQNSTPFTLQIGCSQTLAVLTGIRVIGQFRVKDMSLGGQGAPLVPAFHHSLFQQTQQDVFVINLGGIANITYLPAQIDSSITEQVIGFDTGPANALLDEWFCQHHPKEARKFDNNGSWANSGTVIEPLLHQLLNDPYFSLKAPKSTGREYFNIGWLEQFITSEMKAADIQVTLIMLTVMSISLAIKALSTSGTIYCFGGGAHNETLMSALKQNLADFKFNLNYQKDINKDNLESLAFAWLARAYDKKIYGNIPAVTGASKATVLGCAFYP